MFVLRFLFLQLANNEFFQALNDRRMFQTDVMTYSTEELVTLASERTPKNNVRSSDTLRGVHHFPVSTFYHLNIFLGKQNV